MAIASAPELCIRCSMVWSVPVYLNPSLVHGKGAGACTESRLPDADRLKRPV